MNEYLQPENYQQAFEIQQQLRQQLRVEDDIGGIRTIAGLDVGYNKKTNQSRASLVLMDYESLTLISHHLALMNTTFPYIPGLLSFREIPVLLAVLGKLTTPPDVLMVDGQGIAHPRRMGIAAHLGLLTNIPSLGVAKSKLTGLHDPLSEVKNSHVPLTDKTGEVIGTVLRSKEKCNPLFISPGHRISQLTALKITQHCLKGYRLPEPTRLADKQSKVDAGPLLKPALLI